MLQITSCISYGSFIWTISYGMVHMICTENIEQVLTIVLQRNHSYYTLTLLIPIMLLTLLAPVGLILPGIGLQLAFKLINSCHCILVSYCHLKADLSYFFSSCWRKNGISNGASIYHDDLC